MGIFRFKQFSVNDDGCAMKVGTDAVLLGAWTRVGAARTILDIGTGPGIIALMMAQRSHVDARVDAVEILIADAAQATQNVKDSPWPEKITVINTAIQNHRVDSRYDLIVCNPPFFSRSLLPPDQARSTVRHELTLSHHDLINALCRLMSPSGACSLVLPPEEAERFISEASIKGLHLTRLTRFHSRPEKAPERYLMTFTRTPGISEEETLYLYSEGTAKTPAYLALTSEFYL